MKNLYLLLILSVLLSFTTQSQSKKQRNFDIINPTDNNRPKQFLTNFLRNNKQLNLNRNIKKILLNPNLYSDSRNSLRTEKQFSKESSRLTRIFLDNVEIFGEGINRLYVIENTQTDEIEKITRSYVSSDQMIKIYSKKKAN